MKVLEKALKKLEGRLLSIERNTISGFYEIKIGLPKSWMYESNDNVEIKVLTETDDGVLLQLSPANEETVIDDLIDYVNVIVTTNEEIAKKEEEFNKKMEEVRNQLESEVSNFYEDLEKFKQSKFQSNIEEENTQKEEIFEKSENDTLDEKEEELLEKISK